MSTSLTQSATALATQIRSGQLRSVDVVEAHIAHAQRVNPRLNAIVNPRYSQALEEARALDAQPPRTAQEAPLLGVPCTIKENFAYAGMPQASGLVSRREVRAVEDAPAVARIKAAGAIPIGTTNTSELCMWMESNNRVYGRSNNPYNPRHIVGGSSGGEGAIIGSGASVFGLGADVGGSIRMPAFFNGVFGHKPSPGIVPNAGQVPLPSGKIDDYCVTGPLARRAEDLYPLLCLLAEPGMAPQDPAQVDLSRLRLLSIPGNGRHRVHPELRLAQEQAFAELKPAFAQARKLKLAALKYSFEIWSARMQAAGGESFAAQLANGGDLSLLAELGKWSLRRSDHTLPALALAAVEKVPLGHGRNLARAQGLQAAMDDLLGDDGVLLYPSYSMPAPKHYTPMLKTFHWTYCGVLNVLEMPSTQVPLGLSSKGLPLGIQVAARRGNDHLCLAVAQVLQARFGGWVPPWQSPRRRR